MKRLTILFFSLSLAFVSIAQQNITLEDIWQRFTFFPRSVPGFNFQNDGSHYTRLEQNRINQYDLVSGNRTETIFDPASVSGVDGFNGIVDDYSFSDDETKILIKTATEQIYRHSTRANFYVYDRKGKTLKTIFSEGKQRYATFNPQGDKVAFVHNNNLYYQDFNTGKVTQITNDGATNSIINGATDWVYEEEFAFDRAFEWSGDGETIAFLRFDESAVKEFTMTNYRDGLYPEYVTFKYPKVGETNAKVTVHLFNTALGRTLDVAASLNEDYYIPRIKWTKDPNQLCVYRMNRHQSQLELLLANAKTGKTTLLLKESSKTYISEFVLDNLFFLEDGKSFLWTSEKDGWHHIYRYDMKGKQLQQLTAGQWDVTELYGIDEKEGLVYYQAAEKTPLERQVYSVSTQGKRKQKLANAAGWNSAQFSSTFDYFVLTHSTINNPETFTVYDKTGKEIRKIEDNSALAKKQETYGTQPASFFAFENSEGVELNGYMIKPANFNENQRYPVLMFVYGGPGSQTASDSWKGQNYWWFQMLAQQGYIVVSVDNRGTGARGVEFKKMTYQQLGKYETIDQIEAAKYLGTLNYVDPNRIGIFGWSYGGYMSSLCAMKGEGTFKAAIAVAPVTNWKWYDTIYTERFMRTEEENPDGYRDNSPVYFADQLQGAYLLVHGLGDDNVHFQHTAEMTNALISANKQFDTYLYPNRNHGIFGDNARLHLYTKMTNFLNDNLRGPGVSVRPKKKPRRPTVPRPTEKN